MQTCNVYTIITEGTEAWRNEKQEMECNPIALGYKHLEF
jgi:hypothetical protein